MNTYCITLAVFWRAIYQNAISFLCIFPCNRSTNPTTQIPSIICPQQWSQGKIYANKEHVNQLREQESV
ncbi:hypothetical protein EUGRSUZ_E01066 [Eucalyptus grandis]|uniref:Uncharacterized protein n=2 Tax=Eucalyptus grandis TaxID=71139 RepID=A0ACC3KU41_EUCGR|nr:hypothetical protein EUGRSUZ_E01066 [Eucalyptus grandis]